MADRKEASTTPVVPTVAGLAAAGMMAVGFGAGYGARAWNNSEAKRELLEKFPEQPTLEAEALARRGGFRAFAAGTALAGLMGVGAVFVARSYGIMSMQQFGAMLTRTPQGIRTVRTGYAHRPPAYRTYRRCRPAAPGATTARVPASGVPSVPRTVAPQVAAAATHSTAWSRRGSMAKVRGHFGSERPQRERPL